MNPIYTRLIDDINTLGLPIDFLLTLKDFSKYYYARYVVESSNIILYTKDEEGNQLPYSELLTHVIHEAIHHYQWKHDPKFIRLKGIMHNSKFWELNNYYVNKALELNLIERNNIDEKANYQVPYSKVLV